MLINSIFKMIYNLDLIQITGLDYIRMRLNWLYNIFIYYTCSNYLRHKEEIVNNFNNKKRNVDLKSTYIYII